jgi:hypothetical protein
VKRLPMNKGDPSRLMGIAAICAAGTVLLLALGVTHAFTAGAASRPGGSWTAQRKHLGYANGACEASGSCTPPLLYKVGAGVQETPAVHLILWGNNWNSGVGAKLNTRLKELFVALPGSSHQGILTQYFDTKGRVGMKLTLATYVDTKVAAPTLVDDAKIQEEVDAAIVTNSWTVEFDSQFIVLPAPGSTYETGFNTGFCGYHEVIAKNKAAYGFVAYAGGSVFTKCTGINELSTKKGEDATVATTSHEYSELATDPYDPITWATSDTKLVEIADMCSREGEVGKGLWVQALWDNFKDECVLEDASPAFVYEVTEPASEATETSATLNGTVNPESMSTNYLFEYGANATYGSKTASVSAGSGRSNVKVKASVAGLTANTTYHFRLVAKNTKATGNGRDQELKTT